MRQPMKPRNAAERRRFSNLMTVQRQQRKRRLTEVILAQPTNLTVEEV